MNAPSFHIYRRTYYFFAIDYHKNGKRVFQVHRLRGKQEALISVHLSEENQKNQRECMYYLRAE